MPLRHVIKNGRLKLEARSIPTRVKRAVIAYAKPTIGGVELEDIKFAAFPIAAFYLCSFCALFIGMLYYQVDSTANQSFLYYPRIDGKKETAGLICEPIPRNQSQLLYATWDGSWSNDPDFRQVRSLFEIGFDSNAAGGLTEKKFKDAMKYFQDEFKNYSDRASSRPAIWSLMILCSITLKHPSTNIGVTLSTDASFIFSNIVSSLSLSNANGVCVGQPPGPKNPVGRYLSASFDDASASLELTIPFTVNRQSIFGSNSTPEYKITFSPVIQEPCPKHGAWAKNVFNAADPEFRDSEGSLEFDVRSLLFAVSLNLNLVATSSVVLRSSKALEKIGMISIVDPWYIYPAMQRFYCLNKTSAVWAGEFKNEEERKDQSRVLDPAFEDNKYNFPNICFLVSSRKSKSLQFFYPIVSQLKTNRKPCFYTPRGCGNEPSPPFSMSPCTCPSDTNNTDCNRQSIYTGLIYDVDIVEGSKEPFNKAQAIIDDRAVRFGIKMQRKIVEWKKQDDARKENANYDKRVMDYDQKAMNHFSSMFEATMLANKNPLGANLTRPLPNSPIPQSSANQQLREAWGKLGDGLSAIVIRTFGIQGSTNFILPIGRFNVQLSDLVPKGSNAEYFEPGMNTTFPATMCQDLFNFDVALEKLSATMPLPLTETFERCKREPLVTAVVALGSAWSTTNLLGNIFWAITGFVAIVALRRAHCDSPTTLVSRHTKQELSDLFQEMKDEALVDALRSLRGHSALPDEPFQRFCRLHLRGSPEDQLALGAELSDRANQRASTKHDQLMERITVVGGRALSTKIPSSPQGGRDSRRISMSAHPLGVASTVNPLSTATSPHSKRFSFVKTNAAEEHGGIATRRGSAPEFPSQQL